MSSTIVNKLAPQTESEKQRFAQGIKNKERRLEAAAVCLVYSLKDTMTDWHGFGRLTHALIDVTQETTSNS